MQTPIQIDCQGQVAPADVRSSIERHVTGLERKFGRITSCRVVVKAPGGHHQTGGLYEVAIQLSLPNGRNVDVDHTRQNDERYSDIAFAVNDTFKRARRQLQDQVRRMQGQVKEHEGQPSGTVRTIDPSGEYGFLAASDGHEVYFHKNSVLDGAFSKLRVGSRVSFFEERGEKGPQASTVRLLGKHSLQL